MSLALGLVDASAMMTARSAEPCPFLLLGLQISSGQCTIMVGVGEAGGAA